MTGQGEEGRKKTPRERCLASALRGTVTFVNDLLNLRHHLKCAESHGEVEKLDLGSKHGAVET